MPTLLLLTAHNDYVSTFIFVRVLFGCVLTTYNKDSDVVMAKILKPRPRSWHEPSRPRPKLAPSKPRPRPRP